MRGPNRKERLKYFLIFFIFSFFSACGSADDEEEAWEEIQAEDREIQQEEGSYRAILRPVNPDLEEGRGMANITIRNDHFSVQVRMDESPSNVLHPQNIYEGSSCPDWGNDTNKDGFIDINEGKTSYGKILIPLDRNLSSQLEGYGLDPVANRYGNYVYQRSTSRSELMSDLRAVDLGLSNDFSKLASNEPLNLSGKVIVVHGVQGYLDLPTTVGSAWGEPNYRSLPIACGKILRANSQPESEETSRTRRPPRELPTTITTTTTITRTIVSHGHERKEETIEDNKIPDTSLDDSFLDDDEGYLGGEE
jgi:hypothetical protein